MAWGQRAAILKRAKHPAAAKLYLSWSLSPAVQQASFDGWSARTDIAPAARGDGTPVPHTGLIQSLRTRDQARSIPIVQVGEGACVGVGSRVSSVAVVTGAILNCPVWGGR